MCLYPIDGNLPPNLHRRQISLCQASGLHLPHANLLADFRLPDQYWEVHQRVSEEILVDFYSLCSNGNKLCGSFLPTTRTPRTGRTEPAGRNRSDLRLTRRPLLVSTYAYTLRLALLRCLPSCARRSNYSLYHSRTLPLWLGIPAPTSLRKCYLLSRRMYIGTDPRKTKPFLPPIYMGCCTTHFIMCRTRKSISREFGRSNHYLPGIMSVTLLLPTSDESLSSRLPVHRTTYASHSTFSPVFTMLAKSYLPLLSFDPTGILFLVTATALAVGGSLAIEQMLYRSGLSRYFFGNNNYLRPAAKNFHTSALHAAPTKGATMKSHSCERACPPSSKAGPILRAGLTDVPVIGIQTI